jgi:hypothetical protein
LIHQDGLCYCFDTHIGVFRSVVLAELTSMSRSHHAKTVFFLTVFTASAIQAGRPKPKTERSIPTGQRVVRLAIGGGTLVFERTDDSSTLRAQPQSWIALWQSSEKAPFYVFGQVLQNGTDAAIAIATLSDSQVQFSNEVARSPEWNSLHEEANWLGAPIQRAELVDAGQRWVLATK